MPHKFNANRRHKFEKKRYRVTNWPAYNKSLRQRGDVTVWLKTDVVDAWTAYQQRCHPCNNVVGIRKNMKNYLLPIYNKLLMRKRFIVETVFGVLKQDMGLEHSRHRSPINAIVHLLSCLVAYCLKNQKPKMSFKKDNTLLAYP